MHRVWSKYFVIFMFFISNPSICVDSIYYCVCHCFLKELIQFWVNTYEMTFLGRGESISYLRNSRIVGWMGPHMGEKQRRT